MRKFWFGIYLLGMIGCKKETARESTQLIVNTQQSDAITANTWLALGDSYTIGQGVEAKDRFVAQTIEQLSKKNIRVDSITYIATTGWTTIDLKQAITSIKPEKHKVVSLLIGVNDQYRRWDTGGYRIRFKELLLESIRLANGKSNHVFVLSIPDYSVTPYARNMDTARISKEIDQFNQINKAVTNELKCYYIDITGYTRQGRLFPLLISADSLHPSGMAYKQWADQLVPEMERLYN
jgi:lysophospholipase L1-like esterase